MKVTTYKLNQEYTAEYNSVSIILSLNDYYLIDTNNFNQVDYLFEAVGSNLKVDGTKFYYKDNGGKRSGLFDTVREVLNQFMRDKRMAITETVKEALEYCACYYRPIYEDITDTFESVDVENDENRDVQKMLQFLIKKDIITAEETNYYEED